MKAILRSTVIPVLQLVLLMMVAPLAAAYIGPGSGISVIGSLLGLLATVLIALGAIALFPFRKMMKKRSQAKAKAKEGMEDDSSEEPDTSALEPLRSEGASTK